MIKEWNVDFTIEGRTSFFYGTKEEAEKEAKKYLSELSLSLYPECDAYYEINDIYTYDEEEEEE